MQSTVEKKGAILVAVATASQFLEIKDMSSAADQLACVAKAENYLCEHAGPVVGAIIAEIEKRLDLKIGEVRITINPAEMNGNWGGINCVITQADFGCGRMDSAPSVVADGVQ